VGNPTSQMKEEVAVLIGQRRGRLWHGRLRQRQVGKPTSVEFDWAWVLGREECRGDVIGFYHTHPPGLTTPSQRDVRTMRAWVGCFGKPLLCVIESAGVLTGSVFADDKANGIRLDEIQWFPPNIIVGVSNK